MMRPGLQTRVIRHRVSGDNFDQMRETIRLIGRAIRAGSTYLPIRNHAAALASQAPAKDYLGQVKNIYDDAIRRWRYVKDPVRRELVSYSPQALWRFVLAGDGIGVGRGKGAGDCDCISSAIGAELEAIGMPTRVAITAPPGARPGRMFGHVFIQAKVPGHGWISVDPVVHPKHGFAHTPAHSRIAFFNLDGDLLGAAGNVIGLSGLEREGFKMSQVGQIPDLTQWHDYGLGGDDGGFTQKVPEDWREYGLPTWGAYADRLGWIDGCGLGLAAEVETEMIGGRPLARTPMLELSPRDYRWVQTMRKPYPGMQALGDTGAIYEFDGTLGFFKRIWGGIKKVAGKIRKGVRKVISKIPGGKYLIKLGQKVMKVAKKFVRPLARFVGKYAAKLAPVAALIPGYGSAIAAGLYTAGKVANLMNKYDVALTGPKGKARGLKFRGDKKKRAKQAKAFQKALKKAAEKEKRRQKKGGKIKKLKDRKRGRSRRKSDEVRKLRKKIAKLQARAGRGGARAISAGARRRRPRRSIASAVSPYPLKRR